MGGGKESSFIHGFHGSNIPSLVLRAEPISREVTFYRYLLLKNNFPARIDCECFSLFFFTLYCLFYISLSGQDFEHMCLGFLWNFPENVCSLCPYSTKTSDPHRLALLLPRGHFPGCGSGSDPGETFHLHLAVLLATAGSVASQKAIEGAAYFNELPSGGTLAAPGISYTVGWRASCILCGGQEGRSQLHTRWLAANGKYPSLLCSRCGSPVSWSSCSLRPVTPGLPDVPVSPLFWESQTMPGGIERRQEKAPK